MDHSELAAELPNLENLPSAERLRLARKRRQQQLKRYSQYEKTLDKEANKRARKTVTHGGNSAGVQVDIMVKPTSSRVHFASNIVLLEAAARNDVDEVARLLEARTNPDSANEDGLTALHQCCIDDNEEMCRLLIQYGANVNARDSELWTPLHAAATCGHAHLCKLLIENGAELLAVNADGNMPYDICEDEKTLDYVENEMAKREITQQQIDQTRTIPERKMLEDMKFLLSEGLSLNYFDEQGATPMHIAAAAGYTDVTELLLKHRVPTDMEDKDGWQALHIAAFWGHLGVLEMLLFYGADLDAPTKKGETVFDICEDAELRSKLLQLRMEVEEMKRAHRHLQPLRRASTLSISHRSASNRSVRRSSMREKSMMSRKEAKQEAEMRSSVSDLPDLGVTHEEPESLDGAPAAPSRPVSASQVSVRTAQELPMGNGAAAPAQENASAPRPRPRGPPVTSAPASQPPVPPHAQPLASAAPTQTKAPSPRPAAIPETAPVVTNGHCRTPGAAAAPPVSQYQPPAPPPHQPMAKQQQQQQQNPIQPMNVNEPPLRRFKAPQDEVVGGEGKRESRRSRGGKACCTIM